MRQIVRLLPPSTANRFNLGSSRHFSSRISSQLSSQYEPTWFAGRQFRGLAEQRKLGDQGLGDEGIQPPGSVHSRSRRFTRFTPDKIDLLRKGTYETLWSPDSSRLIWCCVLDQETVAELRDLVGSTKGPQKFHWRVRELDSADVKEQMVVGGDELDRIKYRGIVLEGGRAGSGQYPIKAQSRYSPFPPTFAKAVERAFASLPSTSQARRLAAVEERQEQIRARLSRYQGSNLSDDAIAAWAGHIRLHLTKPRGATLSLNRRIFTEVRRELYRTHKFDHEPLLREVGMQDWQRETFPPIPARLVVPEDASDKPDNGLLDFSRRTLASQASVIPCEERMQLEVLTLEGEWVSSSLRIREQWSRKLRNIARELAGMPPLDKQLPPGVKATLSRVDESPYQARQVSGRMYFYFFPAQEPRTELWLSPEMMITLFGRGTRRNLDDDDMEDKTEDKSLEWVSNISICDNSRHLKLWVRRCDGSQWHEYRPYLKTQAAPARWRKKQDFLWTRMKAQQEQYEAKGFKYPRLVLDANGLPDRWIEE